MATLSHLDPELAAAVERAREQAAAAGELTPAPGGLQPLPDEVADAIVELLRDGTYAAAVARVIAGDPDLADE